MSFPPLDVAVEDLGSGPGERPKLESVDPMEELDRTDPALLELFEYQKHHRVEEYLFGRCTIFALALHNLHRYDIELLWGEPKNLGYENDPFMHTGLEHAFCIRRDGSLVDARGTTDREKMVAEYHVRQPRWARTSKAELLNLMEQGVTNCPDRGELLVLRYFILQNQDVYKLGRRTLEPLSKVRDHFDLQSICSRITEHNRRVLMEYFPGAVG